MYKDLRSAVSIFLIASFVLFLMPFPSQAKITPKPIPPEKQYKIIIIEKGDTLWELSDVCYKNPKQWSRFTEFNAFTNPHWIYPGEKLAVSIEDAIKIEKALGKRAIEVKEEEKEKAAQLTTLEKEVDALKTERLKAEEIRKEVERLKLEQERRLKEAQADQEASKVLTANLAAEDEKERIASLEAEIEKVKASQKETIAQKEERINGMRDQVETLRREGTMLEQFVTELREKLSGADTEIGRLREEVSEVKRENQEVKNFAHFLALGIACGVVLISQIQ